MNRPRSRRRPRWRRQEDTQPGDVRPCVMDAVDGTAVRLLGRPAFRSPSGAWTDVAPGIAGAALCYMAFHARPVARDELIALFWPEHDEPQARVNLRSLLWRLNHDPLVRELEPERHCVHWRVRSDLADLAQAAAEERWGQAWTLLQGDLLEGFVVPRAPEFESWLELERATLREFRRGVGMRLVDEATSDGRFDDAVDIASPLYRSDPYDEAVVRALMSALARRGSRYEALGVLETFTRRAEHELGVAPESITLSLADDIRAGRMQVPTLARPKHARRHEHVAAALRALVVAADVLASDALARPGDAKPSDDRRAYVRGHPRAPYDATPRTTRGARTATTRHDGVDGVLRFVDGVIDVLAEGAER